MIVSLSRRFIYFKAHKVAGTSTLYALARACDPAQDYFGQPRNLEGLPPIPGARRLPNHSSPQALFHWMRQNLGNPEAEWFWNDCDRLVNVRNPYEIAVSAYFWETQDLRESVSISDWYDHGPTRTPHLRCGREYLAENLKYYLDETGQWIPTGFIRFEHLDEDLAHWGRKLGLSLGPLPTLKAGTRRDRQLPGALLPEHVVADLSILYAPIIERFSYELHD